MRQQSCTYKIDNYGTRDFAILAVLFKAHKIVYACACLVPHPFWPDQLKIASAGPDSLIDGIKTFWRALTPDISKRYINHLHKVIPKVIEVKGEASGY